MCMIFTFDSFDNVELKFEYSEHSKESSITD